MTLTEVIQSGRGFRRPGMPSYIWATSEGHLEWEEGPSARLDIHDLSATDWVIEDDSRRLRLDRNQFETLIGLCDSGFYKTTEELWVDALEKFGSRG